MSATLPKSKSTSMKTYSKRVNSTPANSSKKRKRDDEVEAVEAVHELPKATRPRTMLDFFKPKVTVTIPACPSSSGILGEGDSSSGPVEPASTPPSSPPVKARVLEGMVKAQPRARRRLGARTSLPSFSAASSDDENEETSSKSLSKGKEREKESESSKRVPLKPTSANLQQRQLDVGISAMKHCKECKMDYNSTLPEDRKLHDEYHKRKLHLKPSYSSRQSSSIKSSLSISTTINGQTHEIRTLDSRGPTTQRKEFESALEIMYTDLPGQEITPSDLWSEIDNPIKSSVQNKVSPFKIFALLIDSLPAAILIAERISHGGGYLDDYLSPPSSQTQPNPSSENQARFKSYTKPDIILPALLSIERIWVSSPHRRHGLATKLIDHARKTLIPGLEIKKNQVAFSWPTALGRGLAMRYSMGAFEEAIPFLVNLKDCPGMDE